MTSGKLAHKDFLIGARLAHIRSSSVLSYLSYFHLKLKVFFDILPPKTKPFFTDGFYRPPSQNGFIDQVSEHFDKLSPGEKEFFFLGDFNTKILLNGKSI